MWDRHQKPAPAPIVIGLRAPAVTFARPAVMCTTERRSPATTRNTVAIPAMPRPDSFAPTHTGEIRLPLRATADARVRPADEHTVSMLVANLVALALTAGVVALALAADALRGRETPALLDAIDGTPVAIVLLAFALGIVAHEALHVVGFRAFGGVPWRGIRVGIMWRALAPYATASVPLTAHAYRAAIALPGLALGVLPLCAGLAVDLAALVGFGVVMTGAAGGDLAVLVATRRLPATAIVRDHPRRVGCHFVARAGA